MPNTAEQPMDKTAQETSGESEDPLVDRPTTKDLLGFDAFASSVAESINKKNTKIRLGIYGEWGSGKTSFLRMVEAELNKELEPIRFNAWEYDKEDRLGAALLKTILDQAKQRRWGYRRAWAELIILLANSRLRDAVFKLGSVLIRLVLFIIGIIIILGLNVEQIVELLKHYNLSALPTFIVQILGITTAFAAAFPLLSSLFDSITKTKESLSVKTAKTEDKLGYRELAFSDEFKTFGKTINRLQLREPLVVFIDDLDRCSPEKTIQVLEAIVAFQDSKDFDRMIPLLELNLAVTLR